MIASCDVKFQALFLEDSLDADHSVMLCLVVVVSQLGSWGKPVLMCIVNEPCHQRSSSVQFRYCIHNGSR